MIKLLNNLGPISFEQWLKKEEKRRLKRRSHSFLYMYEDVSQRIEIRYMLCRLSREQLILGREKQISIQNEELRIYGGMGPFKMKFLPNSRSVHECAKTLRGGMKREVESRSSDIIMRIFYKNIRTLYS